MEVGLPSWEGLVQALLFDAMTARKWSRDRSALVERASADGVLAAAEIVAALLDEDEREARIRRNLYGSDDPADLYPGPLARALTRMQRAFGRSMRLVTTNYDELLEAALQEKWDADEVHSYVKTQDPRRGHVSVTHLHGVLGTQRKGKLILSERDYHALQRRTSWQERWMLAALNGSTCIFLGASLTDPNILRYLHGHVRRFRHFALFRRAVVRERDEAREQRRWESIQRRRWGEVGVVPLFVDNHADVSQFVHEVTARRLQRNSYVSLPNRLQHWFDRERRRGCLRQGHSAFVAGQHRMNEALNRALDGVLRGFDSLSRPPTGETFAIALWALYLPRNKGPQERVAIWASSDRITTTSSPGQSIELSHDSEWTGIRAISDGVAREEEIDVYTSRWKYVYAVPVFRQTRNYRLPLGAITLSTTADADRTVLTRLPPGIRPSLSAFLSRRAEELLDTRVRRTS